MLTELCQYLKNWFDRNKPKYSGQVVIENGAITSPLGSVALINGQYFRIIGSALNDGVHKYGDNDLVDETFSGSVWAMAIPPAVVALADDIAAWRAKYESVDSAAMSPYTSESFGGYSYSKSVGSSANGGNVNSWQSTFASRLNPWRKL